MTIVYFVRHAEPNYNNHDDVLRELSVKGWHDRLCVTKYLKEKNIKRVLSSPYKRAVDTIKDFADTHDFEIEKVEAFRERKVDDGWIEDFSAFTKKQWEDFSYKLPGGECLNDVQERNIEALNRTLEKYKDENIVIGTHGTALSTIIHFYDASFNYADFQLIKDKMPWVVRFVFNERKKCLSIQSINLDM